MIWRRRTAEEKLDLKRFSGEPAQLLLEDPHARNQETALSCTLDGLTGSLVRVTLADDAELPEPGTQIVLEVVASRALLQCFTQVERTEAPHTLLLRRPARTHIVQRRRYPRAEVFVAATYRLGGEYGSAPAQLINLSVDGAAMVTVDPVQVGRVISLSLDGIGLGPGDIPARVVRCSASPNLLWVVGLSFGRLPPEQEQYLDDYVGKLVSDPPDVETS